MRRVRFVLRGAAPACLVAAAAVVVVAGCLPAPATEQARAVSTLWTQFVIAAAIVGAIVWGLITIAIVRYRRRPADVGTVPPQIADSRRLEIAWTALPILTILGLFGLTLAALGQVDARAASRVTVDVTAFRWQWRFDYEGTAVSVVGGPNQPAEMVVPVGEPIHIVLTSVDVDHAFFVPQFLFKRDAIPGHPTEFDVTITDEATYSGQCAEFCGVFHDRMTLTVRAVSRAAFDAWLASQAPAASQAAAASQAPASGAPSAAPGATPSPS
jgi:cytochrome c oxidase subunit II